MTKFEFEFDDVRTSNVSTDSKFDKCFKRFVVECEFVEKNPCSTIDFMCTDIQRAQTNQFSQIQPITQTTVAYE